MENVKRVLFAGDEVMWMSVEHGLVKCKVMQNEDGFYNKIKITATIPGLKNPIERWIMKVRLYEQD